MIENQDGAAKIANKYQTTIGLLNDRERNIPGANSNAALWATKPQINPKMISDVPGNSNGVCYTDNKRLSVVFNDEYQKIEGRNYSNECSNVSASSRYDGGKFWSMSSVSRAVDRNIAPTITHEFGHLIHNDVDPGRHEKMKSVMRKLKMKLADAPTQYGTTNFSEFWAESLTAYVYAPEWLIETHPRVNTLVEKLLAEYNIEKSTVKQYFRK